MVRRFIRVGNHWRSKRSKIPRKLNLSPIRKVKSKFLPSEKQNGSVIEIIPITFHTKDIFYFLQYPIHFLLLGYRKPPCSHHQPFSRDQRRGDKVKQPERKDRPGEVIAKEIGFLTVLIGIEMWPSKNPKRKAVPAVFSFCYFFQRTATMTERVELSS